MKLQNPERIRLLYNNFKRRTVYPFLIWNGSKPKEILTPNLDLQLQSSMAFSADGYDENANPELYQQCEVKVVALEYLSNHHDK